MVTRAKAGIFKPIERMNCHVTTTSPLPRSHVHALRDPNWKESMLDKYNALITNGTWVLVPRPANVNVVRSMWLFKHKFNAYGSLSRYKARLVANGRSQQQDIDCDETFSLWIIASLHSEFAMKDLGSLNCFLGISAQWSTSGLFLSQSKFTEEILEWAHMQHCNPCKTPVDTESKLGSDGDPVSDPTLYRSLAVALQYLTFTRPDISYVVQHVCLYMHDPREPHFTALKRILRYVRGTVAFGLQLHASSTAQLTAYTDVTLSRSSVEAEYCGVANVVAETTWLQNLLLELHAPLTTATLVYCNNVRVLHVPSWFQYADIFTKGLLSALFCDFHSSLNVRSPPVTTVGEY
ncbi:ribonuclease H-like domain-containing protein [Tanacetum coccineum]